MPAEGAHGGAPTSTTRSFPPFENKTPPAMPSNLNLIYWTSIRELPNAGTSCEDSSSTSKKTPKKKTESTKTIISLTTASACFDRPFFLLSRPSKALDRALGPLGRESPHPRTPRANPNMPYTHPAQGMKKCKSTPQLHGPSNLRNSQCDVCVL